MADNVTAEAVVTPGAIFASDDNAGVQHPYVKLEWGADNTFTKVDSGAGALPIQDGGNSITVDGAFYQATQPVSAASLPLPTGAATAAGQAQPGVDIGDVTVNNAAGASAVNVQDGGNSLTVDNTQLSVVGGGVEATALRVTLANDSTGLLSIDDNGGSLTVDGTIAVTQSGTWDEVGINDSGNSITVDNPQLSVVGTGTEAAALRVTVASDSTGLLSVDDNGGSLTVDGTVTANSGTNLNTSALALEAGGNLAATAASLAVLDNIVAGSEAQVDIVAALPAGTNLIGYVGHGKTIKTVSGSLTADTDVIALVAAKRLKVIAYSLVSVGTNANTVIFKSNGTAGTELWRLLMQSSAAIAAGANLAIAAPSFLFATVAGEKLTIDVNQTDTIHYSITYFDDDAT